MPVMVLMEVDQCGLESLTDTSGRRVGIWAIRRGKMRTGRKEREGLCHWTVRTGSSGSWVSHQPTRVDKECLLWQEWPQTLKLNSAARKEMPQKQCIHWRQKMCFKVSYHMYNYDIYRQHHRKALSVSVSSYCRRTRQSKQISNPVQTVWAPGTQGVVSI